MRSLSEVEQVLVRRVSVFAGSFSPEAMEAVCAGEGIEQNAIAELLCQCIDRGIIMAEGQEPHPRYRLSAVLHQAARRQLVMSGEEGAVYQRLVAFYSVLAEHVLQNAFGPERASWLHRLEREHMNLRAILSWLVEHGEAEQGLRLAYLLQELWFEERHTHEGRQWLAGLLALPQAAAPTPLRAQALDLAGALALNDGDYATARSLKEEGLTIIQQLGDPARLGYALLHLGHVVGYAQGDYPAARALYQEGLQILRGAGHEEGTAHALANLARVALEVGDYQTADPLASESLRMYRRSGTSWDLAQSLLTAAGIAAGRGMTERAVRLAGASAAQREALGVSQSPAFRERDERMLERAWMALHDEHLRSVVWQEGQAMSLTQAVAYALEDSPSTPATL